MKSDASADLEAGYLQALKAYLDEGGEAHLLRAYEVGREALVKGLGVLHMVGIHHQALVSVLGESAGSEAGNRRMLDATHFFLECLSPFEMVHRSRFEANAALRRLNDVLEEEARRIAHQLHDEAAQLLATVYLDLAEATRKLPDGGAPYLGRVRTHLDQMREHLRNIAHELRPPILDDLGLLPALRFFAERITQRSGLTVTVLGNTSGRMSRESETALYRIVQESVSNILQHAGATSAEIRVERDAERVHCSIRDNGAGFDVDAARAKRAGGSMGLVGIRERLASLNGSLEIHSQPGQGTELVASIPLE